MKNYNKLFKGILLGLIVISVAVLVAGFVLDFEANDGAMTDVLFYWAYVVLGIALASVVLVGIIIALQNNAKSVLKGAIALVAVAAACFVVYLVSPGAPAMGTSVQADANTLKLTDTVLNLTYITGAASILAIICGEVISAIRGKKAAK